MCILYNHWHVVSILNTCKNWSSSANYGTTFIGRFHAFATSKCTSSLLLLCLSPLYLFKSLKGKSHEIFRLLLMGKSHEIFRLLLKGKSDKIFRFLLKAKWHEIFRLLLKGKSHKIFRLLLKGRSHEILRLFLDYCRKLRYKPYRPRDKRRGWIFFIFTSFYNFVLKDSYLGYSHFLNSIWRCSWNV